ncbi:hypothetical protein HD554DRAFT_2183606 [Boletus coccyginus]|nr:hypothetical protein HD554DRAFT_2183606 [Boletus coccyginus]
MFALSQKIALTRATFLAYILPPEVCLYLMGVLVQLKGTRFYRLALLPVLLWFSWRGIFVDMSGGDPRQALTNTALILRMSSTSARGTRWAVAREPFRRQSPWSKDNKSNSESVCTALWNAWDLMFNPRGIGWNWPLGLIVPKPALETESRIVFVLLSAAASALYALGWDACLQTIRVLSPDTFGSLNGGSLFDHTLPHYLELLRAVLVSFLVIWMGYFGLQYTYLFLAIVGVILFHQHPSQWPPLFDAPWLATSLSELWGRRWHQLMRDVVLNLGGRPFNYLFGRLGGLLGAFFISGIIHDIELRSAGRGGNSTVVLGFWMMNGVGVVLERIWTKTTGRRVAGVWGWMWTFGWLTLCGVRMVDEWARTGRFGMTGLAGEPSLALVAFVRKYLVVYLV